MAISEVCQVWIEQRIEDELKKDQDSITSFRKIGREIAEEIERLFEIKVKPRGIESKARRMAAPNGAPATTTEDCKEKSGFTGFTKSTLPLVEKEIKNGKSERKAVKIVAEKTGNSEETIRTALKREKAYQEEKEEKKKEEEPPLKYPQKPQPIAEGKYFATIAISQLKRIDKDDLERKEAFRMVINWIKENR